MESGHQFGGCLYDPANERGYFTIQDHLITGVWSMVSFWATAKW